MKKSLFTLIFFLLLLQVVSSQIIIENQPDEVYNLGDSVIVPISIKALTTISGSLEMNIICGGLEKNFYKNGITLLPGEEIKLSPDPKVVLTKEIIGELKGLCRITAKITNQDSIITDEFRISTLINVKADLEKEVFNPEEYLIVEGTATKESGTEVEGFVEISLVNEAGQETEKQLDSITKGYFNVNKTIEKNLQAGKYFAKINTYEKTPTGEITNQGSILKEIYINQIPKNLEIVVENKEIKPNSNLEIKAILHDQTGTNIPANLTITIKNSEGKTLGQTATKTDELFIFPIKYNEKPAELTIIAETKSFTEETKIKILENPEITLEMVNDSLTITNIGNVEYCNESLLIKIGEEILNLDLCLKVDENKKFRLTAPNGEYQVEIIKDGESKISQSVMLTGKAINIKESSGSIVTLMKYPFVWIFIIFILGFMGLMVFKKGYKKSFFGYIKEKTKRRKPIPKETTQEFLNLENKKAEISLSIKGEKQKATILCLKIKNLKELKQKKETIQDTLKKLSLLTLENKASIYENSENFFFIFSPVKTKTFKNEKAALDLAQKIKELFEGHNKIFKQKIDFGISLNNGEIVSKLENNVLKFMSIKDALTGAKRISSYSKEKIILTESIAKAMSAEIKTEKHHTDGITFFTIIKYKNSEEHQKFIANFLRSIEKKKE